MAVKGADLESELIDTVCERVRERLPAGQVAPCESFVRQYYQWVPAEDLADRNPLDLYGAGGRALEPRPAAQARRVEGAGLQPGLRAARVAVAAHADRDRHRRHAVHRRLGDDAAGAAGLRDRPRDPPGDPGQARRRRPHDRGARSRRHRGRHDPRIGRPRRGRPRARPGAARPAAPDDRAGAGRCPRRGRGLAGDARARAGADRRVRPAARRRPWIRRSSRRPRRSSTGWRTTTSRSSATASTT